MKELASSVFVVLLLTLAIGAQSLSKGLQRIELYSPFVIVEGKPSWDPVRARASCLYLFSHQQSCPTIDSVSFGSRFGDNWNIFQLEASGESRSRMIDLGKLTWEDSFKVPHVKPLRKLAKGETRGVVVNTSGTKAPDGQTYGRSTVTNQVNTSVIRADGSSQTDDYAPYVPAIKGHMYVIRAVKGEDDYYMLLRVDEVENGEKVSISYKKVKAPKGPRSKNE